MSTKRILPAMLSLALFLAFPLVAGAYGSDDDDGDGQPLELTTRFTSKFEDPNFGVCKVKKRVGVKYCGETPSGLPDDDDGSGDDDDGWHDNDDDDGGPIGNLCSVCGDNQFEYIYRVGARTNDAGTTLPITSFFIPVPSTDVISAGFIQGYGTVAPSATTVDPGQTRWDFGGGDPCVGCIQPGQKSEDLYICSWKGPDFGHATVTCQFGIDTGDPTAPPNCLGPAVDCNMPVGSNGLGDDDDDGYGDDDDGLGDNDDDDDGGGFNPVCPTGPFSNMGSHDDDDD